MPPPVRVPPWVVVPVPPWVPVVALRTTGHALRRRAHGTLAATRHTATSAAGHGRTGGDDRTGVGRAHGLDAVGGRPGERCDQRAGDDDGHEPAVQLGDREEQEGTGEAEHEDCDPQPALPVGAGEQDERPGGGGGGRRGEGDRADRLGAVLPGLRSTHADQCGDRGGEGDRVVLVEDAGHQRERHHRDEQPATPDHVCRAAGIRARRPAPQEQADSEEDQGRRDQPGDLAADARAEHPPESGGAPAVAAADGAGLVAADPAEAVVAEGDRQERVVLRAADVGAHARRDELDDGHPPGRREDHRCGADAGRR